MKRIDIDPTDENLIDLIAHNPIQRNEDLADFAGILKSIEGGYTIFLDSDWGDGKTFFVKQLKLLLEGANKDLPSDDRLASFLIGDPQPGSLANFKELNAFVPIYYNAWENDYWDDPLPSIAASIAQVDIISNELQTKRSTPEKIAGIVDGILEFVGRGNVIETIKAGFTGEDLIKDFSSRSTLRDLIKQLVDQILPDENSRLLLIIDELDRCKPSFALRVLEELKTLFELDRVIILYALNTSQLIYSVEGEYGVGLDATQYLARFYDLKVPLRKISSKTYLETIGLPASNNFFYTIAKDMGEAYEMSLRDMNRYYSELARAHPTTVGDPLGDYIFAFAEAGIMPVILAMKISEPNEYKRVINNLNAEPLFKTFALSKNAVAFLDETLRKFLSLQSTDDFVSINLDAKRLELLQYLIILIWDTDTSGIRYRGAYQELVHDCWAIGDLSKLSKLK